VPTRVLWYRRDLRVHDLPALVAAADGADALVPLFVLDPRLTGATRMSPARLVYLCAALADLDAALGERGSRLVVRRGDPREVLPAVAAEVGADAVHRSADHTPFATARDADVDEALAAAGIASVDHPGVAVHEPGTVRTGSGDVYRVFTPFHRSWKDRRIGDPLPAPEALPPVPDVDAEDLPTPKELGAELADDVLAALPAGGETAARERLDAFLDGPADDYDDARDLLAVPGTSRLSADLHYGCLSPREVHRRCDRRKPGHATFATEIAWRDFYLHVMAEWPESAVTAFNPAMRDLPWRGESADARAWAEGRTGFPVVDAGMRQLLAAAWLHNRARMIVASFLCKDLLVDWRWGEAHFLRHLVDGDVASNNGGWQWAAGTGTDAQPFFRIFNPVTQGKRFDPDGDYVRRYVPELDAVPTRWIHAPWEMPEDVQEACGVRIGVDYPAPIVDHAEARREALAWFEEHRG
jgi:deoxyribodipyrimidine photo-lyase